MLWNRQLYLVKQFLRMVDLLVHMEMELTGQQDGGGSRAEGLPPTLSGQIHKLMEEVYNNPKAKDWTHGGSGMGIQSGKEMYNFFRQTPVVRKGVNAFMRGYVRPPEQEYQKRQDFAKFLSKYFY